MSLVKGKNVSMGSVTVSAAKSLDNGAKLVYVNYNGGRFNIQTPPMDLAWDVNCYDEGPYPKYSCEVSFKGMDEESKQGQELKGFHDRMLELENKMIDEGVKNGVTWFKLAKGKVNKDVISSKFGPIIRVSKDKATGEPDGKWPSTMRLKIQFKDDKFGCKLVDTDGDQYLINKPDSGHTIEGILVKGAKVKCIIQCVGLWIASGNYMCQWQLARAEVELPEGMVGDEFLPDSDEEGEEPEPKMLVDSDDEPPQNNVDEDLESKPKPAVVKRKKKGSN